MPIIALIPAIAAVGSSVVGAVSQAHAASSAAAAQQKGIGQAIDTVQPYNQFGQSVLPGYQNLLTNPQSGLEQTPGYQFAMTQGLKAVQNSATARGLGVSGAAQKGAASFATGLADQTYGNQVSRYNQAAQLGAGAASSIAGLQVGSGNAAAQGKIGVGNAVAGGASNIGNLILGNQLGGLGIFGSSGTPAGGAGAYGANGYTGG